MPSYSYTFDAKTTGESKLLAVLNSIDDGVKKLVEAYTRYTGAAQQTTVTINNFTRATQQADRSSRSFFWQATTWAKVWNIWNRAIDVAIKRLRQFTGIFTTVLRNVQSIGGAFQDSAAEFRAYAEAAGATKDQIQAVTDQSKLLGRTTRFTAKQSMDGAVTMVKAGEKILTILRDQKGVLLGASAASLSMSQSASVSAHAQKFFGQEVKNAEEALKMQIATAAAADVTVLELDAALTKGAGAANRANQSFSRFNAGMALFAEKSTKGRQAGNDYLRIITALTARTPRAERAIRELGVRITEMRNGKEVMRDLGAIFEDIQQSLQRVDFTKQSQLLRDLFGRGLLNSAQIFLNAGIKGFDEMEQKILKSLDAMKKLEQYKAEGMTRSLVEFQSAAEGVYVELTDILKVPIRTWWQTLGKMLNVVSDRVKDVAQQFAKGKMTIREWREIMQTQGVKGLFSGLSDELKEELETLKQVFLAGLDTLKALLVEFWEAVGPHLEPILETVGEHLGEWLGKAIVAGIKIGMREAPKVIQEAVMFHLKGGFLKAGVQWGMQAGKGKGIAGKLFTGVAEGMSEHETSAMDRILKDYYRDQAEKEHQRRMKPGPLPFENLPKAVTGTEGYETPGDQELRDYVARQKQRRQQLAEFQALPEAEQQRRLRELGRQGVREAQESTEASKEELEAQIQLFEQRKQYNETLQQSKNLLLEAKLTIIESGKEFAKWLLAPFDAFAKKINDIRARFDDVIAGLQQKKVDLAEKFGLVDAERATTQRQQILQKQLDQTQRRIAAAVLPEDAQKLQEKAAGLAEKLADLTGDKQYAQRAMQYLTAAEKSALKSEDIEIKRVGIERKAAKESIPLYQSMLQNATTAAGSLEIMKALQENFKSLGKVTEAAQLQRDIQTKTIEAAQEQVGYLKLIAERLQRLIDVEEHNAEANETTATTVTQETGPPAEPIVFPA